MRSALCHSPPASISWSAAMPTYATGVLARQLRVQQQEGLRYMCLLQGCTRTAKETSRASSNMVSSVYVTIKANLKPHLSQEHRGWRCRPLSLAGRMPGCSETLHGKAVKCKNLQSSEANAVDQARPQHPANAALSLESERWDQVKPATSLLPAES